MPGEITDLSRHRELRSDQGAREPRLNTDPPPQEPPPQRPHFDISALLGGVVLTVVLAAIVLFTFMSSMP